MEPCHCPYGPRSQLLWCPGCPCHPTGSHGSRGRGCHGCSVACAAPPRLRRSAPRGRWRSDAARRAVKPCCRRCSGTALSPWNSVGRRRRSWARRKWMGNWGSRALEEIGRYNLLMFLHVSPTFIELLLFSCGRGFETRRVGDIKQRL